MMYRMVCLTIFVVVVGCDGSPRNNTAKQEQAKTEANQRRLLKVQPPVQLDWSLEREQINRRTKLWNVPNKVSYIYLIDYGKIFCFYTIKGKVSSVNSAITNTAQIVSTIPGGNYHTHVLPSPAEDGSYGTNGSAIFFFTTDGTYVEWNGHYLLADKPLKLTTPPTVITQED